jgi:hypothetical protein
MEISAQIHASAVLSLPTCWMQDFNFTNPIFLNKKYSKTIALTGREGL